MGKWWPPLAAMKLKISRKKTPDVLPPMPADIYLARPARRVDWRRVVFLLGGIAAFLVVYLWPFWGDAIDLSGVHTQLTREGRASLALFCLAAIWWTFEVVPIGATGIAIGVAQALFLIRPAQAAFGDFMDPAIWFVIGSLIFGKALTKTGLTQRVIYKIISLAGDRTSMIVFASFAATAILSLVLAHAAVAAIMFPLLMAIHSLYNDSGRATRFGKGLFIGLAYACGAGSIVTMFGSARGPVAAGLFHAVVGRDISFSELSFYMLPLGWGMVLLISVFVALVFKPEEREIRGLQEKVNSLYAKLGKMTTREKTVLFILAMIVISLAAKSWIAALDSIDKSAILLAGGVLLFLGNIMEIKDLEDIPWNIVLLFGGAMSLGICLLQTGAADWLAVRLLVLCNGAPWVLFVLIAATLILIVSNAVMNVAVIAVSLPVALILAGHLGVAPEIVFYSSLAAAGMPFMLLIGAAPNAIAFESRQFRPVEFFRCGIPASAMLILMILLFALAIWPAMGMPILRN